MTNGQKVLNWTKKIFYLLCSALCVLLVWAGWFSLNLAMLGDNRPDDSVYGLLVLGTVGLFLFMFLFVRTTKLYNTLLTWMQKETS